MKKKSRKKINNIFMFIGILLAILLVLLIIEFNVFENLTKNTEKIIIEDECSLFMGNLIHKFNSGAECETICGYECDIRKKNLKDSVFIEKESSCHECICYCR